jgi:hypothetical protein
MLESKWNKFVDNLRTALGQAQFKVEWRKGQAIPIDHIAQTLVKRRRSRSLPVSVGSEELSVSLL